VRTIRTASAVLISIILLQGCASSDISRGAAGQVDKAYMETDYALNHPDSGGFIDSYQNASQTTKGALLGGAAGAGTGSMSSGIGVIPGAAVGAIFGGALGAYIDSHTTLVDKLENRGVKVISLGDHLLLVIPSSMLFNEMTANIRPHAYSILDLITQFVSGYPNMAVNVAAYTGAAILPEKISLALSQQQADAVVKYLWTKGIDTRLLSAAGRGGTKLVAHNIPEWRSDNYRVEITMEKCVM
jgi:outer membrane protein OmpA-like peptidoglycan-associated protein